MEVKAPPSFFEISINTDKFSQFTSSLNAILANHQKQIQQHTRQISQMKILTDQKVNRVRSQCEYQFQKMDKKYKAESQHNLTYHNDLTVKYQFLSNEYRNKLSIFDEQINKMQQRIDKQEEITKDKIMDQIGKQLQDFIAGTKILIEKQIENVNKKITQMQNTSASHDSLFRNILNAYQNRSNTQQQQERSSQFKPHQIEVSRYATPDRVISLDQITQKEGKQRRRRKIQQRCQQQNLQYASISAKLELLETRLTAKQNQSLDKVVYASKKHSQFLSSQPSESNINISLGKIEIQRKNMEQKISFKLENIESIIRQNFLRLEKQLNRTSNSEILLRDEFQIFSRKFDKEKTRVNELSQQMKKIQQRRVDEKLIENMVTMFKRQYRSLQEQLQRKISSDIFNRQKQRLGERIQVIGQSVSEKADKEEIKRAFQFVEDKMKEIIMVIADDIHHEKEGAVKRIPFKCLSCDKDLQSSLPTTLRHNSDKKIIRPPTSQTSQIRKKVRVAHKQDRN